MTTIDTSTALPASAATAFSNQRKIARTSTGRLWTVFKAASGGPIELWYSDDEGTAWTQNASGSITNGSAPSLFVDADDHAHITYENSGVKYRRMASIGTATSWGSETSIDTGESPDLVVHREGTGWKAHIAFNVSTTGQAKLRRVSITSAGAVSEDGVVVTLGTSGGAVGAFPSIDFHHTGDTKTIQGSTPHVYVAWSSGQTGTGEGIMFVKFTYSAGAWTKGTERSLTTTDYANAGCISGIFDGTRFVVAYAQSTSTSSILIAERDAADTATTSRTPTALSDGAVTALSISFDNQANFHLWAVGTTSDDVKSIEYSRSGGTWDGTWTTIAAADAHANSLSLKRGYAGAQIDAVYTTGTASPYDVVHASAAINAAPTAPTWDLTNNQAHDVAAGLVLDWTFNDPDDGDTQGSYALSRQIGSATIEYWNAGTSTWGASEVQNTSSTSAVTLASSWGSDSDDNHKYAVKTWDAAGLEGTYSSELNVIPSAKDNPTISSPADAGTLTTAMVTATWSATTQTAYKARLLSSTDAELESSGWVTSTATSHAFAKTLSNATTYKVEVTTKNDEGLASTADTNSFTTSFTPPSTPTLVATGSAANGTITVAITNPGLGATESSNDVYARVATGGRADLDIPVGGDGLRVATGVAVDGSFTFYPAGGKAYEFLVRAQATNSTSADSAWT